MQILFYILLLSIPFLAVSLPPSFPSCPHLHTLHAVRSFVCGQGWICLNHSALLPVSMFWLGYSTRENIQWIRLQIGYQNAASPVSGLEPFLAQGSMDRWDRISPDLLGFNSAPAARARGPSQTTTPFQEARSMLAVLKNVYRKLRSNLSNLNLILRPKKNLIDSEKNS